MVTIKCEFNIDIEPPKRLTLRRTYAYVPYRTPLPLFRMDGPQVRALPRARSRPNRVISISRPHTRGKNLCRWVSFSILLRVHRLPRSKISTFLRQSNTAPSWSNIAVILSHSVLPRNPPLSLFFLSLKHVERICGYSDLTRRWGWKCGGIVRHCCAVKRKKKWLLTCSATWRPK